MDPDSLAALRRTLTHFLREDPALVQAAFNRIRGLIEYDHSQMRTNIGEIVGVQDLKNRSMHEIELFANELAHITDPRPANWRVVPLWQTRWYHKGIPQEYQIAFAWTAPACRKTFLVCFDPPIETLCVDTSETRCTPEEEKQELEQEKVLRDVICTYTTILGDGNTYNANRVWIVQTAILKHFRSRPRELMTIETVILSDSGLKTPGWAEPFLKRIAMILDPAAATAWQVVPLCHTPWFNEQIPQHMQRAFGWTSQRYRARFWVYPSVIQGEYKWFMRSTPFGTPDQERILEEDKALAHAIRTYTVFNTQSDARAILNKAIVTNIRSVVAPIATQFEPLPHWATEKTIFINDTTLKSLASPKPFFTHIARITDKNAQNFTWGRDLRGCWGFSWNSPRYNRDFLIYLRRFHPDETYMISAVATADAVSESGTEDQDDFFQTSDGSEADEYEGL